MIACKIFRGLTNHTFSLMGNTMWVVQERLVTVVTRTWPNLGISRLDRRYGSVIVAWFEVCRRRGIFISRWYIKSSPFEV